MEMSGLNTFVKRHTKKTRLSHFGRKREAIDLYNVVDGLVQIMDKVIDFRGCCWRCFCWVA